MSCASCSTRQATRSACAANEGADWRGEGVRRRRWDSGRLLELQLRLARRAVSIGILGFGDAVEQLTNLHRRLGFGDPCDRPCVDWIRYVDGLDARPDLADQVRWTTEFAASSQVTPPPSTAVARAGPFSVHVQGDLLRTHFVSQAPSPVSPLHGSFLEQRRRELRAVLSVAMREHPEARRVRGTSWLYSTRSYRAIFPPSHVATGTVRTDVHRFQGSSAWGQFLDHRGGVKRDLATRFVSAVDTWDGAAPWTMFPIPTLVVESPIETFDLASKRSLSP